MKGSCWYRSDCADQRLFVMKIFDNNLARRQVRAFGLAPHDAAEEYFKLALDGGVWVSHALHIEDRVRKLR